MREREKMSIPNIPGFRKDYNPYLKQIGIPRVPVNVEDLRNSKCSSGPPHSARDLTISGVSSSLQDMDLTSRPTTAPSTISNTMMKTTNNNNKIQYTTRQPKWVTTNDCLRFYAYFEEDILEGGGVENSTSTGVRIRKFVIYYYVVDDTIMIDEPRTKNSGLPQGMFMKKQRLVKPRRVGKGYYSEKDFLVGTNVEIYGRDFKIVDADNATRDYMQSKHNITLTPSIDYPSDPYSTKRAYTDNRALLYAQGQGFQEVVVDSSSSSRTKESSEKLLPYTERDNKVLCFRASFVELVTGDIRPLKVYYYVSDDTLEIKETVEDGRMQCSNMLKRQRLPKDSMIVPTSLAEGARDPQRESFNYVTWKDLKCGTTINIYGRDVLLVDCDGTTRKWYEDKGILQVTLQVKNTEFNLSSKSKAENKKSTIAPPNGFGTDDDLYALGFKLEPKKFEDKEAMKENFHKAKDTLRMVVYLVKADGSLETNNQLLLNYFVSDSSISLFAPEVRNSGIWGGLFLARAPYKKYIQYEGEAGKHQGGGPGGAGGNYSRPLNIQDFLPGSGDIVLEAPKSGTKLVTIRISSYDEYSLSKLRSFDSPTDGGKIKNRLQILGEKAAIHGVNVRSIFNKECSTSSFMEKTEFMERVKQLEQECCLRNYITSEDIDLFMATYPYSVDDQQVENQEKRIAFNDFVDGISMAAPRKVQEQAEELAGKLGGDALFILKKNSRSQLLGSPINGAGNLRNSLRSHDTSRKGTVSFDEWASVLQKSGLIGVFTKATASSILLSFDTTSTNTLDYNALCDAVFDANFELPLLDCKSRAASISEKTNNKNSSVTNNGEWEADIIVSPELETELYSGMMKALNLFSSCFNRFNRKRILRKHWMAFDGERTGRISRKQFLAGLNDCIREFDLDIDFKAMQALALFIFPHPNQSKVLYDSLLEAICNKNIKKCIEIKNEGFLAGEMAGVQLFKNDNSARARDFGGSLKVVGLSNHN